MKRETIAIRDEWIRLDNLLKLAGAAPTGGQIKLLIQGGGVRVGGAVCTQRGKKLRPGESAEYDDGGETVTVEVSAG